MSSDSNAPLRFAPCFCFNLAARVSHIYPVFIKGKKHNVPAEVSINQFYAFQTRRMTRKTL